MEKKTYLSDPQVGVDVTEDEFRKKLMDIQDAVNKTVIPEYSKIQLQVSIGGVICTDETVADAVLRADSLMYIAKNRKNIVIIEMMRMSQRRSLTR